MPFKIFPTENFANLRQNGGYYVDKTRFLEQFLNAWPEATLFTRPRRFGKSLFLSMLAEFFDIRKQGDGQTLFEGLAVSTNEKLCQEWMHQYPVISITLKGIDADNYEDAVVILREIIGDFCKKYEVVLSNKNINAGDRTIFQDLSDGATSDITLRRGLLFLTKILFQYYGKPVILLIDEYDVPVSKAADHNYYNKMLLFMRNFLSDALKSNPYLKFAILTGALRITKESFFTGLNNLKCYDIASPDYEDIFGFTQDEVDKMLTDAGCEERRDIIREWYDGYHFGERTDMYCPWSITNYLYDLQTRPREPQAYWVSTSGNELTKGFVDHVPANIQDDMASLLAGNSIDVRINESLNYSQIYNDTNNFWTLLYLTGYLTTTCDSTNYSSSSPYKPKRLTIPNKEVLKVFEDEITSWFDNIVSYDIQSDLFQKFWDADAHGLEKLLNETILSSACFLDYQYGEHFYHSLLLGIFIKYNPDSNRAAGTGIPDLTIHDYASRRGAVVEVKRARSVDDLDRCVQAALEQIADRKYDERLKVDGCEPILHWGMAFFKKSCRVAVRLATTD